MIFERQQPLSIWSPWVFEFPVFEQVGFFRYVCVGWGYAFLA